MPGGLQLFLLRHGETVCPTSFYGHRDVALSDRGRAQALSQARWLERVRLTAIYCSDLERAHHGARAVAERQEAAHGDAPRVEVLPALREMYLGVFEGLAFAEARTRYPALARLRYDDLLDTRIPGGESVRDVSARVLPCAIGLATRHLADGRGDGAAAIAVVAHNTVLRVILAHSAGLGPAGYTRFRQGCGGISRVDLPEAVSDPFARATIVFTNMRPDAERPEETSHQPPR
ncbi:MAG: histidine phosphatase family protein [Myxococcales bacterium]|nr:histidine phosphatase family protein [Myxococcales bacterium]